MLLDIFFNTKGNIATEDIVKIMDDVGIYSGVDRLCITKTASQLKRTLQNTPFKSAI